MNTSAYLTALLVRETCFKCQTSRDTEEKIKDLNWVSYAQTLSWRISNFFLAKSFSPINRILLQILFSTNPPSISSPISKCP